MNAFFHIKLFDYVSVNTDANVDESIPENIESEEFNVPDDDESHPTQSDTVVSYCFEEDDEAEELLRNLQLEGDTQETNKGNAKKKPKKKPLVICPRCKHESNTIDNYLKHKATHVMSGNVQIKNNIILYFTNTVHF